MVHHTSTTGVEFAGSPFDSGISNSGLAAGLPVGGQSFLYLGSDGVGNIYKYSKPPILANQIGVFASVGGRDENLACDSASFPGINALWSKDAYNGKLFAYEVELGTCVSPPPPGQLQLGSIAGTKYNDLNGDGTREATEPGLASWTIKLTDSTGATTTTTTASDGSYNFTNLSDGTYTVSEVQQSGWIQTQPKPPGTYTVTISGGNAVTGEDFGNFFDVPSASCVKGPNPSGNIPPANGGQRPDGFYTLLATDRFDPNPQIFVKDTGSGTIFPLSLPGFASGTNIKYTQAPGATPSIVPFSGVVAWHITGTGDAAVYAVNAVGNPSPSVSCLVPPPPK
ncbi:SdrD B-like domain protein [uncultured archaeon]|nr:SdrD B-like domain protein [uncultured archaeon]